MLFRKEFDCLQEGSTMPSGFLGSKANSYTGDLKCCVQLV